MPGDDLPAGGQEAPGSGGGRGEAQATPGWKTAERRPGEATRLAQTTLPSTLELPSEPESRVLLGREQGQARGQGLGDPLSRPSAWPCQIRVPQAGLRGPKGQSPRWSTGLATQQQWDTAGERTRLRAFPGPVSYSSTP